MFTIDSSKGLHYNFAHLALPVFVLMNPRKFYDDISSVNNIAYLKTMWQGLAGKMGVRQTSIEFEVIKNVLRNGDEIFTIKLPKPANVPEAFLVSAVFQFTPSVSKEIRSARYFTLELGKSPYNQSVEYHLCEWMGNVISDRQHKNYGRLENSNVDSFVMAINEILNTDKIITPIQEKLVESRAKSIDEMSDLEQGQLVVEKLLPAMKEVALERLAERDAVMKDTMAYVEQAKKERNRSITRRQIFIALIALVAGICIALTCAVLLYLVITYSSRM